MSKYHTDPLKTHKVYVHQQPVPKGIQPPRNNNYAEWVAYFERFPGSVAATIQAVGMVGWPAVEKVEGAKYAKMIRRFITERGLLKTETTVESV